MLVLVVALIIFLVIRRKKCAVQNRSKANNFCPSCGQVLSVHRAKCLGCGEEKQFRS